MRAGAQVRARNLRYLRFTPDLTRDKAIALPMGSSESGYFLSWVSAQEWE